MIEMVDVLIVGGGASGAAVAWSLADTRMRIVCMEQGDWPEPSRFPSSGRDHEKRQMHDFSFSPNRRQSAADYPVNDDNSPIKIANYNGVGGGTVLWTAHFPRLHPSDFRARSLDGIADDWPIDYETLAPFYAVQSRHLMVRVEHKLLRLVCPDFADVFVRREAAERLEAAGEVVGGYEVCEVYPQLLVALVVEAFDGGLLDGAVHPLDLTVGPGVVRLGEAVLDVVGLADHVEAHLARPGGVAVARLLGELDAIAHWEAAVREPPRL